MKIFVFFVIVAMAAIGFLEWFKAATRGAKLPPWAIPALAGILCLAAGEAAVYGGLFAEFFTWPEATTAPPLLQGLLVGGVALGFEELCYQLVVQVFTTAIQAVIRLLRRLGGDQGGGGISAVGSEIDGEAEEPQGTAPIGFSVESELPAEDGS